MPVTFNDVARANGVPALTAAELLYVRATVLLFESTGSQAPTEDVNAALAALAEEGRQILRAHIAKYKAGEVVIDGGTDAIRYEPILERWAIRNGIRALLTDTGLVTLEQEFQPNTSNALQLVSFNLGSFGTSSEFG